MPRLSIERTIVSPLAGHLRGWGRTTLHQMLMESGISDGSK